MNTLGNRIRDARTILDLSQKALADRAGVSQALITKLETGGAVSTGRLVQLAIALNVRPEWLVSGEEPRRWGQPKLQSIDGTHPSKEAPYQDAPFSNQYTLVPRYAVHASAGVGNEIIQEDVLDRLAFKQDWLHKRGLSPESLGIIYAVGDSMQPTFSDGDVLLLDLNQKRAQDGKIFVLRSEEYLYVKRLQILPGRIQIVSDNPKYQPFEVTSDDADLWSIIGQVVWVGRDL